MKRSLFVIVAAVAMLAGACGSSSKSSSNTTAAAAGGGGSSSTTAASTTTSGAAAASTATTAAGGGASGGAALQASGQCGKGTGQKATGDPIKIGGIATKVPGIDFTWITGMTKAYFDCVNDNGGINGRPIQYIAETETIDPQQIAALAKKLIEQDHVVGLVGNTSIIDCSVNGKYYAQQGYYVIIAGVDQACFTTPNFSAVNMGPYYSSLGGAQAAVRAGAKGTIVVSSPNQPGFALINTGVTDFAKQNGMKGVSDLEQVPIADPAGLAQKLVQAAGDGGGVVLDYTGPTVLPLLKAIEQQGLIDKVVWASSTPPNDPSVSKELDSAWNGKFLVNAEFNVLDSGLPDQTQMEQIRTKYAPGVADSSFAQMGYLAGRVATEALLSIKGDITKDSVNAAFKAIKDFKSDLWCKPWYYDSTVGKNVSNNNDITVVPQDKKWVKKESCFAIAAMPANPLDQIRAKETQLGLNS
jgi:branched-chain amino acid transport system substrate-binding protein